VVGKKLERQQMIGRKNLDGQLLGLAEKAQVVRQPLTVLRRGGHYQHRRGLPRLNGRKNEGAFASGHPGDLDRPPPADDGFNHVRRSNYVLILLHVRSKWKNSN
jgi:hypothetical protein